MQIRFTRHAEDKFAMLARHGWRIARVKVEATVRAPEFIDYSREPLIIAQTDLDETHVLRVVYRGEEEGTAIIITFYPGRKSQYANT